MVGFSRARWIHVLYTSVVYGPCKNFNYWNHCTITFSFSQRIGQSFLGDLRSDHFTEKMSQLPFRSADIRSMIRSDLMCAKIFVTVHVLVSCESLFFISCIRGTVAIRGHLHNQSHLVVLLSQCAIFSEYQNELSQTLEWQCEKYMHTFKMLILKTWVSKIKLSGAMFCT